MEHAVPPDFTRAVSRSHTLSPITAAPLRTTHKGIPFASPAPLQSDFTRSPTDSHPPSALCQSFRRLLFFVTAFTKISIPHFPPLVNRYGENFWREDLGALPQTSFKRLFEKSLLKISKNFHPRAGFRNESRPWGNFLKVLRKLLLRSFLSRVRGNAPRSYPLCENCAKVVDKAGKVWYNVQREIEFRERNFDYEALYRARGSVASR